MNEKLQSYLPQFQRLATDHAEDFELIGDYILVEELPPEEVKTASGLILSAGDKRQVDGLEMNRPLLARILMVGAGYYDDETKTDVPLNAQPGDIVLIGGADTVGIRWLSSFGPLVSTAGHRVGITRESEIKLRFKGQAAYDRVVASLGGAQ